MCRPCAALCGAFRDNQSIVWGLNFFYGFLSFSNGFLNSSYGYIYTYIICTYRAEFMRRTARWTEEQLQTSGLQEWLETWRYRQWAFATDLHTKHKLKWSAKAFEWLPLIHSSQPRSRPPGHPKKRWSADFEDFVVQALGRPASDWKTMCKQTGAWMALRNDYVKYHCP